MSFTCPASLLALEAGVPRSSLFVASATGDNPSGSLQWSLLTGAPLWVGIDSASGTVSITPASTLAASIGTFTLVAKDGDGTTKQQPCPYALAAGASPRATR